MNLLATRSISPSVERGGPCLRLRAVLLPKVRELGHNETPSQSLSLTLLLCRRPAAPSQECLWGIVAPTHLRPCQ